MARRWLLLISLVVGCSDLRSAPITFDAGVDGNRDVDALGSAGGATDASVSPDRSAPQAGAGGAAVADATQPMVVPVDAAQQLDAPVDVKPSLLQPGASCTKASDCASAFCVDGRCCDSDCIGSCKQCGSGSCANVVSVDDPDTCSGSKSCSASAVCLAKDGQQCSADRDCLSLRCVNFYKDADGDGFGSVTSGVTGVCGAGAAAPAGFVATGTDCCDMDSDANPAAVMNRKVGDKMVPVANGCGKWDWNCDGKETPAFPFNSCSEPPDPAFGIVWKPGFPKTCGSTGFICGCYNGELSTMCQPATQGCI